MKKYILSIVLILITMGVSATTLQDAINTINGKEVTLSGVIGYSWVSDKNVQFKSGEYIYDVILEAGRNARKDIFGCKFTLFGNLTEACIADAKAEIKIKGDNIALIIFELVVRK